MVVSGSLLSHWSQRKRTFERRAGRESFRMRESEEVEEDWDTVSAGRSILPSDVCVANYQTL